MGTGLACHAYVRPYEDVFLNRLEFGTLMASFAAVSWQEWSAWFRGVLNSSNWLSSYSRLTTWNRHRSKYNWDGNFLFCFCFCDSWFPASSLFSFSAFFFPLLLCFSAFPCWPASLLSSAFSSFSASLLLCFFDLLLFCFSVSLPLCFFAFLLFPAFYAFPASLLSTFPCFSAYLLLCFSLLSFRLL